MRRARGCLFREEAYCIARLGYRTSIVSFQKKSRSRASLAVPESGTHVDLCYFEFMLRF